MSENTKGRLRGFGTTFENGRARSWYLDADERKRWVDNDELVERDNG